MVLRTLTWRQRRGWGSRCSSDHPREGTDLVFQDFQKEIETELEAEVVRCGM